MSPDTQAHAARGHDGLPDDRPAAAPAPLLDMRRISKVFGAAPPGPLRRALQARGWLRPAPAARALDGVDLEVMPGEVVGLVGESGCGKSTLGRIAAGLLPATSGTVHIDGVDRDSQNAAGLRRARLDVQMIFQDPYSSLNPRLRVERSVGEGALRQGLTDRAGFDDYVCAQLERAGLDPALRHRYPHQFSGGQRQRIGIARALAVQPRLLVCDEAVAALDVSIQAQILNLFLDLREELGLSYLFISHDLGVVRHLSDRVVVMYLGRVVESADADSLFSRPRHPYTQALLAELPRLDLRRARYGALQGEIPSPLAPPPGCHFHPRCPHAMPRCRTEAPRLRPVGGAADAATPCLVACHLNDPDATCPPSQGV